MARHNQDAGDAETKQELNQLAAELDQQGDQYEAERVRSLADAWRPAAENRTNTGPSRNSG